VQIRSHSAKERSVGALNQEEFEYLKSDTTFTSLKELQGSESSPGALSIFCQFSSTSSTFCCKSIGGGDSCLS